MPTGSLKAFWKEVVLEVRWENQGSSGHVERRRGTSMQWEQRGQWHRGGKDRHVLHAWSHSGKYTREVHRVRT